MLPSNFWIDHRLMPARVEQSVVALQHSETIAVSEFGFLGRQNMTKSSRVAMFDLKDNIFDANVL